MIITLLIALGLLLIDQAAKLIIMATMTEGESITVIKDFFYINYVKNNGVAFGFEFTSNPTANLIIQLAIASIVLTAFIIIIIKVNSFKNNKWFMISMALLIGGLLGNVIDRIFYPTHSVTDFLSFIIYYPWFVNGKLTMCSFPFAVFNIADTWLTVGVIMMIIYLIFIEPKREKIKAKEETQTKEDEVINIK